MPKSLCRWIGSLLPILLALALTLGPVVAAPCLAKAQDESTTSDADLAASAAETTNQAEEEAPPKPKTDPELERIWKMEDQAAALYRAGQLDESETAFKRCLAEFEAKFGPEHQGVGRTLFNLGLIKVDKKQYAQAEPLYLHSLAIRKKIFGPNHPRVAAVQQELGYIYLILKKDQAAAKHYAAAAAGHQARLIKQDNGAATYLLALNKEFKAQLITYYALQLNRATDLGLRILGVAGDDQPTDVNKFKNDLERAAAAETRTTGILNRYLKSVTPDTRGLLNQQAAVLHGLGLARFNLNQPDQATASLEQALLLYQVLAGDDHRQTGRILADLKRSYLASGLQTDAQYLTVWPKIKYGGQGAAMVMPFSLRDAEAALRQNLAQRERQYGLNHAKLHVVLRLLAAVVREQGRLSEADEIRARADRIKGKSGRSGRKRPSRPKQSH